MAAHLWHVSHFLSNNLFALTSPHFLLLPACLPSAQLTSCGAVKIIHKDQNKNEYCTPQFFDALWHIRVSLVSHIAHVKNVPDWCSYFLEKQGDKKEPGNAPPRGNYSIFSITPFTGGARSLWVTRITARTSQSEALSNVLIQVLSDLASSQDGSMGTGWWILLLALNLLLELFTSLWNV